MKAVALAVGGVAAERPGDVGAGGTVVVLDQRVDLEAFEIGQLGAGVIGHGVAVAAVGGILVGGEQVAGGRQAEAACRAAAQDDRLGADDQELAGARVHGDGAGGVPVRAGSP